MADQEIKKWVWKTILMFALLHFLLTIFGAMLIFIFVTVILYFFYVPIGVAGIIGLVFATAGMIWSFVWYYLKYPKNLKKDYLERRSQII